MISCKPLLFPEFDYFDEVTAVPLDKTSALLNDKQYSVSYHFTNYTDMPLTVNHNNFVRASLQPKQEKARTPQKLGFLRVFVQYSYKVDEVNLHATHLKYATTEWELEDIRYVRRGPKEFEKAHNEALSFINGARGRNANFVIVYDVSVSRIRKNAGKVFLPEADIMISDNADMELYHPNSHMGRIQIHDRQSIVKRAGRELWINDPRRVFGDKWININGEVFKIKADHYTDVKEGVAVTDSAKYNFKTGKLQPAQMLNLTFEEADKLLGMYNTAEEARVQGDLKSVREKEAQELKHKRHQLETETEIKVAEMKRLLVEEKAKNDRLENKLAAEKIERDEKAAKMKSEYERKSHYRKSSLELLKWLPAFIVGCIGLYKSI